jgi:protein ImuA
LFVDVKTAKNALWAMEEALKCNAIAAVVCETTELSFDESRRLQLAAEQGQVTGFVHRHKPKALNAVTCVSRWRITSALSSSADEMPGLGFPKWNVELLKVRNGQPRSWQVQWSPLGLEFVRPASAAVIYELQTG